MVALPVIPISADSGLNGRAVKASRHTPMVVGACLFLCLMFSTVTMFVREAWALQGFQIGIFALLAIYLASGIRGGKEQVAGGLAPILVYLIPVWGVIQLALHTTASSLETRASVLRWGALAGVFFLTQTVAGARTARRNVLSAFLVFATAMAVLCLAQLFTSKGLVLWLFPTGYPDVYATFPSYNNYAQFVELALPIALWRALREGWRSWWYVLSGGLLYGSVIGSASRAGAALCTAELLAMLVIGLVKLRDPKTGLPTRSTTAMLVMVPVLAAAFTLAVGWQRVWERYQQNDPYLVRKEFMLAAADMAIHRPLTGYGLGTFPEVYQRYAIKDFPFYANHTHNDWAEFAADGGFPFLLLVLIPFAVAVPMAARNPWGMGLIAIMLHACVDFPFPRPAVSGWMFVLLALLYMSRTQNTPDPQKETPAATTASPRP
ncbi:MAG TPA: O-antigen ligase family protein [Terracidiphilus sp.]|nr:O-antigen ligase family protein [Terracidiphilus sp.]